MYVHVCMHVHILPVVVKFVCTFVWATILTNKANSDNKIPKLLLCFKGQLCLFDNFEKDWSLSIEEEPNVGSLPKN